jgi:uncharacterized CHY-type Zn-finger protein
MKIHGIEVQGVGLDEQTRCKHYATDKDVIAIKFPCCNIYYPCYQCHEEIAGHAASVWEKARFGEKAILCGRCGTELTIQEYLTCQSVCPHCHSPFNPGCSKHYPLYFEV